MAADRETVTEHVAGPVGVVSSKKNGAIRFYVILIDTLHSGSFEFYVESIVVSITEPYVLHTVDG